MVGIIAYVILFQDCQNITLLVDYLSTYLYIWKIIVKMKINVMQAVPFLTRIVFFLSLSSFENTTK